MALSSESTVSNVGEDEINSMRCGDRRSVTCGCVVIGRSAKFCTVNLWSAKDESRCAPFLHHVKSAVEGDYA
jgi:hypothetical protein